MRYEGGRPVRSMPQLLCALSTNCRLLCALLANIIGRIR